MGNKFIGLETWGGWFMGRSTSLAGLKGGGRRGVIQCGMCYGSVAMEEGRGVGRLVNEVERVGERGGYVDQFCRRIDL